MRMTTPRIQPLADDQWDDDARSLLAPLAQSGRVLNIFRTLANHSSLARRWMVFANHILGKSTLSEQARELVILRIGYLCQSGYEWGQHVVIARRVGMTDEEILFSKSGPETRAYRRCIACCFRRRTNCMRMLILLTRPGKA